MKIEELSFADLYAMKETARNAISVATLNFDDKKLNYWTTAFRLANDEMTQRVFLAIKDDLKSQRLQDINQDDYDLNSID